MVIFATADDPTCLVWFPLLFTQYRPLASGIQLMTQLLGLGVLTVYMPSLKWVMNPFLSIVGSDISVNGIPGVYSVFISVIFVGLLLPPIGNSTVILPWPIACAE
jgi:hypothetical protein